MARPTKPVIALIQEGKSHKSKAELQQREQAEKALLTGVSLKARKEVKENEIAMKEFNRVNKLLKIIEKNDAIYEGIINRYCLLVAECHDFEQKRDAIYSDLDELKQAYESEKIEASEYFNLKQGLQKQIIALDRQIQTKRKMLFDIERENAMTIASALRSIPKQVEQKANPLLEVLQGKKQ